MFRRIRDHQMSLTRVARKTVKHMLKIARVNFELQQSESIQLMARSIDGRYVIIDYLEDTILVDLNFPLEFEKPPTQELSNLIMRTFDPEADTSKNSWIGEIKIRRNKIIWYILRKVNCGVWVMFSMTKPQHFP